MEQTNTRSVSGAASSTFQLACGPQKVNLAEPQKVDLCDTKTVQLLGVFAELRAIGAAAYKGARGASDNASSPALKSAQVDSSFSSSHEDLQFLLPTILSSSLSASGTKSVSARSKSSSESCDGGLVESRLLRVDGKPLEEFEVSDTVWQFHRITGVAVAELQAAEKHADLSTIPRHPKSGVLMSVGSIDHMRVFGLYDKQNASDCNPCSFFFRNCCDRGTACEYCHFRHRGQRVKRSRPSKRQRSRMKSKQNNDSQATNDSSSDSDDGIMSTKRSL